MIWGRTDSIGVPAGTLPELMTWSYSCLISASDGCEPCFDRSKELFLGDATLGRLGLEQPLIDHFD